MKSKISVTDWRCIDYVFWYKNVVNVLAGHNRNKNKTILKNQLKHLKRSCQS